MEKDTIYKFFEGKASDQETEELLAFVKASPENKKRFENERLIYDAALFATPSNGSHARIMPMIRRVAAIAAMVALVVGITVGVQKYFFSPTPLLQNISTPVAQQSLVTLPDSSHVWLNSTSSLSYSSDYGINSRDVYLKGEAYFEVEKNHELPFIVHTANDDVRVTGTHFNVTAYEKSGHFEVQLFEGGVTLYDNASKQTEAVLKPGQRFVKTDGESSIERITQRHYLDWKNGIIDVEDVPFPDFMERLNDYYNIHIVVTNQQLINYRCTGKFKMSEGVAHILDVIRIDHPFSYRQTGNTIYIE